VIDKAEEGSFLFIDPPYFNADQDKFYTHPFTHDGHFRLSEALKNNIGRFNFLLTYDNSVEVRKMYEWAETILEKEWNYTINRTDDQKNGTRQKGTRYKGKELFIMNYNSEIVEDIQPLLFRESRRRYESLKE